MHQNRLRVGRDVRLGGNRRPAQKNLRFADPWSLRRKRGNHVEPAADQSGRPVSGTTYRRNGRLQHSADFSEPLVPRPVDAPARSMLTELRRRLAKKVAEIRLSGLVSEVEMEFIEAAMRGKTLREIGELHGGISRQAVEDRFQRLKTRAPFFWLFWRRKNLMKSRR